jgi:hypothetical protein
VNIWSRLFLSAFAWRRRAQIFSGAFYPPILNELLKILLDKANAPTDSNKWQLPGIAQVIQVSGRD